MPQEDAVEKVGKTVVDKLMDRALSGGSIKSMLVGLALAAVAAVIVAWMVWKKNRLARAEHKQAVDRERKRLAEVVDRDKKTEKEVAAINKKIESRQKKIDSLRKDVDKMEREVAKLKPVLLPDID